MSDSNVCTCPDMGMNGHGFSCPQRTRKRIAVNGYIAWREGACREDNPFDRERQAEQRAGWDAEYDRAERDMTR